MKVVIIGAGRMGFSLAQQLASEDHEVFLLDRDQQRVELARNRLDVMAVAGSGSGLGVLRELGVADAELLIAVTNSDEVNIVSCLLGRELGVRRRIARVHSMDLVEDLRGNEHSVLGVDEFINPTEITVERLSAMVLTPGTTESAEFADGRVVLRALHVEAGSPLTSSAIEGLRHIFAEPFLIAAVRRERNLVVPKGEFQLQAGDVMYVIMQRDVLDRFLAAFAFRKQRTGRVMIAGAGAVGRGLAGRIERQVDDVILLEGEAERSAMAAQRLSLASVIHGSPLDRGLLEDLRIEGVDFFLGLSDSDELNLSSALLAKRMGVDRALMLTGQPEQVELFESLPVDVVVSPLLLCVGAILRSARSGKVHSLFKIAGGQGEAIEIEAAPASPVVNRPLREAPFPRGVMVAAVIGEDGARLADGNTVIRPGSRLVVVTLAEAWEHAVGLFTGGGGA